MTTASKMCVIHSNRMPGRFFIKYTVANGHFIQFTKQNWTIPEGKTIELTLTFNDSPPWELKAVSRQSSGRQRAS